MGALIRPIEITPTDRLNEMNSSALEEQEDEENANALTLKDGISTFIYTYWIAPCLLIVDIAFANNIYVPNVYLVPYAQSLDYSPDDAAMFLSFISIGDIICLPLTGFLIAHFKILLRNILFYITVLFLLLSLDQPLAVFAVNFAIWVFDRFCHHFHSRLTAVSTLMGTYNISKVYGIFFAAKSMSLGASSPLTGLFVDALNDYSATYWYCVIGYGASALGCCIMYAVVIDEKVEFCQKGRSPADKMENHAFHLQLNLMESRRFFKFVQKDMIHSWPKCWETAASAATATGN